VSGESLLTVNFHNHYPFRLGRAPAASSVAGSLSRHDSGAHFSIDKGVT
jgi:hypothetical protein